MSEVSDMVPDMRNYVVAGVAALALVGCSSEETTVQPAPASAEATSTTTTAASTGGKAALKEAAKQLDLAAVARRDAEAWEFYSPRCKVEYGTLENYSRLLDAYFNSFNSDPKDWYVQIDGRTPTVGTVTTRDGNIYYDASQPKTWSFINGRWLFDNC